MLEPDLLVRINLSQISFDSRFIDWPHLQPSCMIDTTECPVYRPTLYEWEYFSVKHQMHSLKYELAISMTSNQIVWLNGPYKGGTHDLEVAREKLLKQLRPGEKVMGDKGYVGEARILAPFKPPRNDEEKLFNVNHYKVRQSVERMNRRLKIFGCLTSVWCHELELHKIAFYVVTNVTQVEFHTHPLTVTNQ